MEDLDNELISSDDTSYSSDLTGVFHSNYGDSSANPTAKQKTFTFAIAILKWVALVTVFNLIIFYFQTYVIQYTTVSGASMENTLHDHDVLLVDKFSYGLADPKRFDVVVFTPEEANPKQLYVKRVIGLPGETVQIIGDTIFINDKALDEDYGNSMIVYQGIASIPIVLGKDEYFVLGDNRCLSKDSRYSEIGSVSKSQIKGKVFFRLQPKNQIGFIK